MLVRRGIRRGGSRVDIRWLRMRMCGACVSPGMRANPSTCGVLTSLRLACRVSPGGGVPLVGPKEELRGPS